MTYSLTALPLEHFYHSPTCFLRHHVIELDLLETGDHPVKVRLVLSVLNFLCSPVKKLPIRDFTPPLMFQNLFLLFGNLKKNSHFVSQTPRGEVLPARGPSVFE